VSKNNSPTSSRVKTGVSGLDDILGGGLPARRLYLIQGQPGSGKTTLALQFLLEGARVGEKVLYISLSETREEVEEVARSHGWSLDNVEIVELSAIEKQLSASAQNTLSIPCPSCGCFRRMRSVIGGRFFPSNNISPDEIARPCSSMTAARRVPIVTF
jgi:predicted ATP-dependent serine protease